MKLGCKVVTTLIVLDTSPRVLSLEREKPNRIDIETFYASTPCKLSLFVVNDTGVISHEWVTPKSCYSHVDTTMNDWRLHFLHRPSLRYTFAVSLWQKGSLAISLMFHFLLFATHATLSQNITWSEISTSGRCVGVAMECGKIWCSVGIETNVWEHFLLILIYEVSKDIMSNILKRVSRCFVIVKQDSNGIRFTSPTNSV